MTGLYSSGFGDQLAGRAADGGSGYSGGALKTCDI